MTTSIDHILAKARLRSPAYTDEELAAAGARLASAAADRLMSGALTFDDATSPTLHPGTPRPEYWETDPDTEARDRDGASAAQDLLYLCQLVICQTDALHAMSDFIGGRIPDTDGARVLACVLHLAGREDSARFWWQFAAGADDVAAKYCLFLHHLALGEVQEANWWHDQIPKRGRELWSRAARGDRYAETLGWATCLQIIVGHKPVPEAANAVVGYVRTAVQFVDDDIDLPLPADGFAQRIEEMTANV